MERIKTVVDVTMATVYVAKDRNILMDVRRRSLFGMDLH